jgi:hypothetical protein
MENLTLKFKAHTEERYQNNLTERGYGVVNWIPPAQMAGCKRR